MQEIVKEIEYLTAYVQAVQSGLDKFQSMLPLLVKQEIKSQAKRKLNATFDQYMDSVKIKYSNFLLVVELDREDWLSNAVESGTGSFDLKNMLQTSKKTKTSKLGYKYMRIPMGKQKNGKPGTDKGKEFQDKINQVLMKPKYGISKLKNLMSGQVVESQKILSDDPSLQGFYRTRVFESAQEFHSGKKPTWGLVLFRTISENPASKTGAKWIHPGIKPVHILRSTERWLDQSIPNLLNSFIEAEVKAINERF